MGLCRNLDRLVGQLEVLIVRSIPGLCDITVLTTALTKICLIKSGLFSLVQITTVNIAFLCSNFIRAFACGDQILCCLHLGYKTPPVSEYSK